MPDNLHVLTVTVAKKRLPPARWTTRSCGSLITHNERLTCGSTIWMGMRATDHLYGRRGAVPVSHRNRAISPSNMEADLWLLKGGKKKPEKISLLVASDEKQTTRRREKTDQWRE